MANSEVQVSKKAEEALIYKLKQHAMKQCTEKAKAYAECAEGRTFSVVWSCRGQLNELNACLHACTTPEIRQQLFRRYAAAGQPERPDWEQLLSGL